MAEFCKFPSIEQFRHAIKDVERCHTFFGLDEQGKPVYDTTKSLPTFKFRGTVKLHGTNAAIVFSADQVSGQSRTTMLSETNKDQFGFFHWIQSNANSLQSIKKCIPHENGQTVYLFGEWCGESVQRGVALQKLPKMFVLFAGAIRNKTLQSAESTTNDDDDGTVADSTIRWMTENEIKAIKSNAAIHFHNIYDFETFDIEIDFNHPELSQPTLQTITNRVEKRCPVSFAFGSDGCGEGVVWKLANGQNVCKQLENLCFKVKGEEHAVVKGKEIAAINTEKQESIIKFVTYAVTENRLKQGIENVFGKAKPSMAKTNEFLKWIEADIVKEESDTIKDSNLDQKDVLKHISAAARQWLVERCKQ